MKRITIGVFMLLCFFLAVQSTYSQRSDVADKVAKAMNGKVIEPINVVEFLSLKSPTIRQSDLKRYKAYRIDRQQIDRVSREAPKLLKIRFPLNETQVITIDLVKTNLFSPDFTIGVNDGPFGSSKDVSTAYYHGIVELNGKSGLVALGFANGGIEGLISLPGQNAINITSLRTPGGEDMVTYTSDDIDRNIEFTCGTKFDNASYSDAELSAPIEPRDAQCVRLWMEINYNVYQNLGSDMASTTAFSNAMFNALSLLYANERISLVLEHLEIWSSTSPYPNPSDPGIDDRTEFLNHFKNYRAATWTGDLAILITQNNIGGMAAGFSGLCNADRTESMCIAGLYANYLDSYPAYFYNVYNSAHELGHLFGSRHTHACVWNGNNTAIDGCAGYIEGFCNIPPYPTGGGTIMSYCWNPFWIDFQEGFGVQPGNVIRNRVYNAACLTSCSEDNHFELASSVNFPEGCGSTAIPGTMMELDLILNNQGVTHFSNLTATLQPSPEITLVVASQSYPGLEPGVDINKSFSFTISSSVPCGSKINLVWNISDGSNTYPDISYTIYTGEPTLSAMENFDAGAGLPTGWASYGLDGSGASFTVSTESSTVISPPNSLQILATTNSGTLAVESPSFAVADQNSMLSFYHRRNYANGFEGGSLEIKIGSDPWMDIVEAGGTFISGGYNGRLSGVSIVYLSLKKCWTGKSSNYELVKVQLPSYAAGENVKFRWIYSKSGNNQGVGHVRIDNIEFILGSSSCTGCCPIPLSPMGNSVDGITAILS